MNDLQKYLSKSLLAIAALLVGASLAWADGSRDGAPGSAGSAGLLGAASGFTILGGAAVTCTDGVIIGDVGAGAAFTNTRCMITGAVPTANNAAARLAITAAASAYTALQAMPCSQTLTDVLPSQPLAPGVYCFAAAATPTGTLTLNGTSSGVWIFQVNGALTAGATFSVAMTGGAQPCNVYWAVNGAATTTDSAFKGNILAGNGAITLTRGSLAGRALASAAVTVTGASVVGCGALAGSSSCKDKECDGGHKGDKGQGNCDDAKDGDKGHESDARYPFESKDKGGRK